MKKRLTNDILFNIIWYKEVQHQLAVNENGCLTDRRYFKVKTKVKQWVCMVIAFVASFMVTVTAYASTDADTFDFYVGKYYHKEPNGYGVGYVDVNKDSYFYLFAYADFIKSCFVSGEDGVGIISKIDGFDARFDVVTKCRMDGSDPVNPGKILEYKATGDVNKGLIKAEIISHQSQLTYVRK